MKDKFIKIIEQLSNLEQELEITRDYDEANWTEETQEMYAFVQAAEQLMINAKCIADDESLLVEIKEGDPLFDTFYNDGEPYHLHRFAYMNAYRNKFTTPGVVDALVIQSGNTQYSIKNIEGVQQPSVNAQINGKRKITIEKASELADKLGMSIHFFLTKK